MSGAVQKCQLDGCTRATSTKCFCCQKNVCTKHFMQHIEAVKAQVDPLINDINEMVENIRGLTLDQITEPSFVQLQQWKSDMHRQIDEIFLAKSKEMEDLIATNKEKFVEHQKQQLECVIEMQDQVRQLVEDEDVTLEQIQALEDQIATVEKSLVTFEKDFLSVNTSELAQGMVTISSNLNKLKPSLSATAQPYEPKPVPVSYARDRRHAESEQTGFVSPPALPAQARSQSLFGGIGSSNIPTTTSAPTFGPSVTTTASTVFTFGSLPAFPSTASLKPGQPFSVFGTVPTFSFGSALHPNQPNFATSSGGFGSNLVGTPATTAPSTSTNTAFTFAAPQTPTVTTTTNMFGASSIPTTSHFGQNPAFTTRRK